MPVSPLVCRGLAAIDDVWVAQPGLSCQEEQKPTQMSKHIGASAS